MAVHVMYQPRNAPRRPAFRPVDKQPRWVARESRRLQQLDLGRAEQQRVTRPDLRRPAFRAEPPVPRRVDFNRIRALDLETNGPKLQISEKSLKQLLTTAVPDPNDTTYLAENRPQRTMTLVQNLGELAATQARTSQDIQNRLATISAWLDTGRDPSGAERMAIGSLLAQVYGNVDPEDLNRSDRMAMLEAIRRLDVKITPLAIEEKSRFISYEELKGGAERSGFYILYIIARALALSANPSLRPPGAAPGRGYDPLHPLVWEGHPQTISKALNLLAKHPRVVDLQTLTIIPYTPKGQARQRGVLTQKELEGLQAAHEAGYEHAHEAKADEDEGGRVVLHPFLDDPDDG